MKKMMIAFVGMAVMLVAVPETMAAPHGGKHHRDNDGLRLAAGIINLVQQVINPAPVVVAPQRPVVIHRRPVVVTRRPARPEPPRKAHKNPPRRNHRANRR